jgi:glycosyltransferase involved in cell wall biosynthesis
MIEAFALGRRENLIPPDVELRIVGCQRPSVHAEARDIVRRIYQPDLRGAVRLVHNVAPAVLRSYYEEADIYAHASIFDCMPLAVLTAMAHGLPIVTTDVDGCKEAIMHESSGLLVQPGELRQMAQALGRLLCNSEQARAFGKTARARFIERFSAEATFPPLYDTLVQHASRA